MRNEKRVGIPNGSVKRKCFETQIVADVDAFPGHIACDAGSRSEIVVPIVRGDELLGVIDVDSYELSSFDTTDQTFLESLATEIANMAW